MTEKKRNGENKNIRFTQEAVHVRLHTPLTDPFPMTEVKIRYMTTRDYRLMESVEGTREELFELLQKLSGLSDLEIDMMKPVDIGACLGVIRSFLHGIQVPLLKSMQSSSNYLEELLLPNSIQ
ncbi:MAG TPA: hypothetical protein VE954_06630 [Oligoflexus sp.]|uniref:hypothetical protein n=1 Tax=Oligoflexus sp. TaxID=1971216 RepID=UPI002D5EB93D|nr:hypothetical protein [Oligoflexus sp.]HYX32772.1 hypothetical protein [Oligoflexus sp.]